MRRSGRADLTVPSVQRDAEGAIDVSPLLPLEGTVAEFAAVSSAATADPSLTGLLLSEDGQMTVVRGRIEGEIEEATKLRPIVERTKFFDRNA